MGGAKFIDGKRNGSRQELYINIVPDTLKHAEVRASTRRDTGVALVGGGVVLMRTLTLPLARGLTSSPVVGLVWPLVVGSVWVLALCSMWLLARILTHAFRRLPPTHGICDESYLYQRSADPAGKSGKCGDESVGGPSVRMLRMPLSPPTK